MTDPEGNVEVQDYDAGFLVSDTMGAGTADAGTWSYSYDPATGGTATETDPNGNVTTNTYYGDCTGVTDCASGRLHTTTNGVDPVTTYTYDSTSGATKSVTAPYGTGSDMATTSYSYANHVNLTSVATPLYDSASPRNLVGTQTTSYTHGDSSHPEDVTTVTDPRGKASTFTYDAYGQPVTATDPTGDETTTAYDLDGRVISTVAPRGNVSGGNPDEFRSAVLTDPGGLPLASLGPGSYPVVDNFDRANGSLGSAETGQAWSNVNGTFAIDGQQAKLSAASGTANLATIGAGTDVTVSFTVGAVQDGMGVTWRAASGTSNERLVMSTGSNTWKLLFDGSSSPRTTTGAGTCCAVGQQVVVRSAGGQIQVWVDGVLKINRSDQWDQTNTGAGLWATGTGAGRIDDLAIGRNAGNPSFASYDADGFAVQSMDGNGNVSATTHDAQDRPLVVTRPDATTLSDAYDGNGRQVSYTDGAANTTAYTYDHQGRPASSTRPGMAATSYAYAYSPGGSPGGETETVTQPSGATITSTMDAAQRLASVDYSSSGTPDVSMGYDHAGNEISMATGAGTPSTWTFDDLGRMTGSSRAGRDVAYGYDLADNQTSIVYPGSHTVTQGFDDDERETSVHDWVSSPITFGYDANSNVTSTVFPNNVTASRTYDDNDQPTLISIDNTATSTTFGSFTQTYDNKSQITNQVVAGTAITSPSMVYRYDALSKLNATTIAFDTADNQIKTSNISGTPVYQGFNTSGQMCWSGTTTGTGCSTTPTGDTAYGYNANGDRTTKTPSSGTATTYSYDQADRLTAISGAVTATYSYDGDGLRLSKTVSSTTTNFTWDDTGDLPMLLVDGTDDYLYGPMGEPLERITSGGTPTFIHQDFAGSTRLLTDATGAVSGVYPAWGRFGQTSGHSGTASIHLGWQGQYQDPETNNYYLRARYYDPNTAQFLTQDPAINSTQEPYGYADGDAANRSDPSGLLGIQIGPIHIGHDGCILGSNGHGCRGAHTVKKVAHGAAAAGSGVATWAGRVSVVAGTVAIVCDAASLAVVDDEVALPCAGIGSSVATVSYYVSAGGSFVELLGSLVDGNRKERNEAIENLTIDMSYLPWLACGTGEAGPKAAALGIDIVANSAGIVRSIISEVIAHAGG